MNPGNKPQFSPKPNTAKTTTALAEIVAANKEKVRIVSLAVVAVALVFLIIVFLRILFLDRQVTTTAAVAEPPPPTFIARDPIDIEVEQTPQPFLDLKLNLAPEIVGIDYLKASNTLSTAIFDLGNDLTTLAELKVPKTDQILLLENNTILTLIDNALYLEGDLLAEIPVSGVVEDVYINPSTLEVYLIVSDGVQQLYLLKNDGVPFLLHTFVEGVGRLKFAGVNESGSNFEFISGSRCYELPIRLGVLSVADCAATQQIPQYIFSFSSINKTSEIQWRGQKSSVPGIRIIDIAEYSEDLLVIWAADIQSQQQVLILFERDESIQVIDLPINGNIQGIKLVGTNLFLQIDTGLVTRLYMLGLEKLYPNPDSYPDSYSIIPTWVDATPLNCEQLQCNYEFILD